MRYALSSTDSIFHQKLAIFDKTCVLIHGLLFLFTSIEFLKVILINAIAI